MEGTALSQKGLMMTLYMQRNLDTDLCTEAEMAGDVPKRTSHLGQSLKEPIMLKSTCLTIVIIYIGGEIQCLVGSG